MATIIERYHEKFAKSLEWYQRGLSLFPHFEGPGKMGSSFPLAFDHADILGMVVLRLRGKLDYADIGYQLLPPRFTLRRLQEVHETILDRTLNKDSFRRRVLASGRVVATGTRESDVGHRPAELYRFVHEKGGV